MIAHLMKVFVESLKPKKKMERVGKKLKSDDVVFEIILGDDAEMFAHLNGNEITLVGSATTLTHFRVGDKNSEWSFFTRNDGSWSIRCNWFNGTTIYDPELFQDDPQNPFRKKIGAFWINLTKSGEKFPLVIPEKKDDHFAHYNYTKV
jgi:hypothetical protein